MDNGTKLEMARSVANMGIDEAMGKASALIRAIPEAVRGAKLDAEREWGIELPEDLVAGLMVCGAATMIYSASRSAARYVEENS